MEAKHKYWYEMLAIENIQMRDLIQVYDELYEYSKVSIENGLKPLKEYYY